MRSIATRDAWLNAPNLGDHGLATYNYASSIKPSSQYGDARLTQRSKARIGLSPRPLVMSDSDVVLEMVVIELRIRPKSIPNLQSSS